MADNLERCYLCSSDISAGTSKAKRRRLLGEASKVALEILDSLSMRKYGRRFVCHTHKDAYLCHKCKTKAELFGALLKKTKLAEEELVNIIGNVVHGGTKRARVDSGSNDQQPEKVIRQEDIQNNSGEAEEEDLIGENSDNSAVSVSCRSLKF